MQQRPGSDAVFLALETPTSHAHIRAVAVLSPAPRRADSAGPT